MAAIREKDALLAQYRIAIAKAQDLQEQLATKQRQWAKQEERAKVTEKLTRELCEKILAKDKQEMVLGSDYSWDSIEINQLLNKSKSALAQYENSRKELLSDLMDKMEERRQTIENLEEELYILKTNPSSAPPIDPDELPSSGETKPDSSQNTDLHPDSSGGEKNNNAPENHASTSPNKKNGGEKSGEKKPGNGRKTAQIGTNNNKNVQIVTGDDDDMDDIEAMTIQSVAEKGEKMKLTPTSPQISDNRKRTERKIEAKKAAKAFQNVDLEKYEQEMDEVQWVYVDLIGERGLSRNPDIEATIKKEHQEISPYKIRIARDSLKSSGIITCREVSVPKGHLYIMELSEMGRRIYFRKHNTDPVMNEATKVINEHTTLEHGYGILFSAEIIKESGLFRTVNPFNRKNPVKTKNGEDYVPDILCVSKSGATMYIEYECANHSQSNFNSKCSKMRSVTHTLNFIVPNREAEAKIRSQVEQWIKSRGIKALAGTFIRITCATQLKGKDLTKNDDWKINYNLNQNAEPVNNF